MNVILFLLLDFVVFPAALYYFYRRQKAQPEKITWLLTYRNEFRLYLAGWLFLQIVFLIAYVQLNSIKL